MNIQQQDDCTDILCSGNQPAIPPVKRWFIIKKKKTITGDGTVFQKQNLTFIDVRNAEIPDGITQMVKEVCTAVFRMEKNIGVCENPPDFHAGMSVFYFQCDIAHPEICTTPEITEKGGETVLIKFIEQGMEFFIQRTFSIGGGWGRI